MKTITFEQLQTKFPSSNREYLNDLNEEQRGEYLELYSKYHKLFATYFCSKVKLLEWDKEMQEMQTHFQEVSIEHMDLYQYMSSDQLHFFYFRNNFYIERLDQEERATLKNINEDDIEAVTSFIENTYKKVINERPGESVTTNFGPENPKYFAKSSNIVLGARRDYSADTTDFDHKQMIFEGVTGFVETKSQDVFGDEVSVIVYNDVSVKPLKENAN